MSSPFTWITRTLAKLAVTVPPTGAVTVRVWASSNPLSAALRAKYRLVGDAPSSAKDSTVGSSGVPTPERVASRNGMSSPSPVHDGAESPTSTDASKLPVTCWDESKLVQDTAIDDDPEA